MWGGWSEKRSILEMGPCGRQDVGVNLLKGLKWKPAHFLQGSQFKESVAVDSFWGCVYSSCKSGRPAWGLGGQSFKSYTELWLEEVRAKHKPCFSCRERVSFQSRGAKTCFVSGSRKLFRKIFTCLGCRWQRWKSKNTIQVFRKGNIRKPPKRKGV